MRGQRAGELDCAQEDLLAYWQMPRIVYRLSMSTSLAVTFCTLIQYVTYAPLARSICVRQVTWGAPGTTVTGTTRQRMCRYSGHRNVNQRLRALAGTVPRNCKPVCGNVRA